MSGIRSDSVERVLEVARALRLRVDALCGALGVTPAGMRVLRRLETAPGESTSSVARTLNLADEAVSRELRSLVDGGLVAKKAEGKRNRLSLTDEGWLKVDQYRDALSKLSGEVLAAVHRSELHATLDKIESKLGLTVHHAEGKPLVRKRKNSPRS